MSFEKNIPHYIESIKESIRKLRSEQFKLAHDCDCEFCEYDGMDEENQDQFDELEQQINNCRLTIGRLRIHADMHKIELPEELVK